METGHCFPCAAFLFLGILDLSRSCVFSFLSFSFFFFPTWPLSFSSNNGVASKFLLEVLMESYSVLHQVLSPICLVLSPWLQCVWKLSPHNPKNSLCFSLTSLLSPHLISPRTPTVRMIFFLTVRSLSLHGPNSSMVFHCIYNVFGTLYHGQGPR